MKNLFILLMFGLLLSFFVACSNDDSKDASPITDGDETQSETSDEESATEEEQTESEPTDGDMDAEAIEEETWEIAEGFTLVEANEPMATPLRLAVQACTGLYNRKLGGSVFVHWNTKDEEWLEALELTPEETLTAEEFLDACLIEFPQCVRYSYANQQILLPNILTIAAQLDAIPLDADQALACEETVFDATFEFADKNTRYLATKYVFENYIEGTTGLAMLNPGYDTNADDVENPELVRDMLPALVDFVFTKKLFVHFLVNGCREDNPERELLHSIVNAGHWPTPVGVYGYNNSWMVMGGYLYEAHTRCLDSRNMGAIPTMTENLSFYATRRKPITEPGVLEQNEPEHIEYDPSKTYVAFIVGDGDNINFIMNTRNVWLRQRLADCEANDNDCMPITWSISPHLTHIAPDVLTWYYASARQTGKDYFTLPPSGHLYAYPTSLNEEDQDRFIGATENDARILDLKGTVHWDWNGTWEEAEEHFLPKYAKQDGAIRGIFPVNVPYLLPTFPWWPKEEEVKVLLGEEGGAVAVFRPHEWRGIDDSGEFFLSPQRMAEKLASYPAGTVTYVYMTSDGGLSLENSFMELEKILPENIVLVSADTASKLAITAAKRK